MPARDRDELDRFDRNSSRGSRLRALGLAVEPYLYSAPALILITAVMLVPLAIGLSYAFRDIQLLNPMSGGYVGLAHFRDLLADPNFWNALKNTVQWTVASVALQFLLGLILALLLNRPFPGRGLVQALVFLPWAVPAFLSGLDWASALNPVVGPLPHWLFALGLMSSPEDILADPDIALGADHRRCVIRRTPLLRHHAPRHYAVDPPRSLRGRGHRRAGALRHATAA